MFAIIRAGGKQYKVAEGDVIEIERLGESSEAVEFLPLLIVEDDGTARARRTDLDGALVTGKVVGEAKGPKVDIFRYRSKTGYRRHVGHRQRYARVQISEIRLGGRRPARANAEEVSNDGA